MDAFARWVAAATVHANAWGESALRDSEGLPAQRGRPTVRLRRQRPARPVIEPGIGGHDFRRTSGIVSRAWQCAICHCTTDCPARLTHQHCSGSAVRRWARQAATLADRGSGIGEDHVLLLTGTVVWCFRCGASACVRAHNLLRPCPRKTRGYLVQSRQRLLLGLHPDTRVPLRASTVPEPGCTLPVGFAAAQEAAVSSGTRPCSLLLRQVVGSAASRRPGADAEHPRIAALRARVRARAGAEGA